MRLKSLLFALLGAAIASFVLVRSCVTKVDVDEVGVRIVQYDAPGLTRGVEARDFGPGWGWDLGPLHRWVVFDRTVQTLDMTDGDQKGAGRRTKPVQPRTSDGYALAVDVTVKYRIKPGEAHKVYQRFGADENRFHDQVRQKAEGSIRDVLGDLRAEDFYNPPIIRERAVLARDQLARDLAESHIAIIDVLIRNVTFPEKYEERILAKKIADQEVEVQKSQKASTTARLEAEKIVAETDAQTGVIEKQRDAEKARRAADNEKKVTEITASAEAYATQTRADADLIAARRSAEAFRLKVEAEAEGVKKKNQALAGAGGRMLVALEAVKSLEIESAEVSTALVDFLNVDAMLARLGLPSIEELRAEAAGKAK